MNIYKCISIYPIIKFDIYMYIYIYIYIYIYVIYVIMKIMCPPGYHDSGFVATHALGHMMHGSNRTSCAQEVELQQSHCGDNREGTMFS